MNARAARRRRQAAPDLPAYLARTLAAHASGAILSTPGIVSDIYVSHEPACRSPQGGRCICRPDQIDLEGSTDDRPATDLPAVWEPLAVR